MRMKYLLLSTFLIFTNIVLINAQGNIAAHWDFNTAGDDIADELISNNDFAIASLYRDVEQVDAVLDKGFRTDGYSTWAEGFLNNSTLPTSEFTLSIWTAIESYSTSTSALFANFNTTNSDGVLVGITKYGELQISIKVGTTLATALSTKLVPRYQWNNIVISANTTDQRVVAYVNGEEYINRGLGNGQIIWANSSRTYIMRHPNLVDYQGYNTSIVNGIIDDIKIYDKAWTTAEATTHFDDNKPSVLKTDVPIGNRFEGDINRPKYHSIPKANWCNEGYGLVFKDGKYHFFYQKQAAGMYINQQDWGHQVSDDLVNWSDEEIVLSPSKNTFDRIGCWSGTCVIADDGTPTFVYTGVDGSKAGMGVATGNSDLSEFTKYENNPVIAQSPVTGLQDFRDPFVWKQGNTWYMIIGAGTNFGGTVLLFKSGDLKNWNYIRQMYIGNRNVDDAGTMWEMPAFHDFGNKSILLVNRIVPGGTERAKTMYFIGELSNTDLFLADDPVPTDLEVINSLLAPAISKDENDNTVAIGIIPDEVDQNAQKRHGWANVFSLPRIWTFSESENRILQQPHPNLETLRGDLTEFENIALSPSNDNYLGDISGQQFEIEATFDPGTAREVGVVIGKSESGDELTKIFYNTQTGFFLADRTQSTLTTGVPKGTQAGLFPLPAGEPFTMRVFIDGSVVEVFINDKYAFATRIFPTKGDKIDLHVRSGDATATNVKVWTMKSIENSGGSIVPKNEDLELQVIDNPYPNPFDNNIFIQYTLENDAEVTWRIFDSSGRLVENYTTENLTAGTHTIAWSGGTSKQLYYATIFIDGKPTETVRILKN